MTTLTMTLHGPLGGWHERRRVSTSLLLSLLLHLAVALALGWTPAEEAEREAEPQAVTVDIVADRKAPGGQGAQARQEEAPPPAPLPKPLPDPAPVAEQSAPGETGGAASAAKPQPQPQPRPKPLDRAALRNARDLMLTQVRRHWSPPDFLRARGGVLTVKVDVRRDGTLGPPFGKDQPWNPAAAIEGLDQLPPTDPRRRTLEDFYRALRQAQPFQLPRELAERLPFSVSLDFRLDDLR